MSLTITVKLEYGMALGQATKIWKNLEEQERIHASGYGQVKGQGKICGGENAPAFHQSLVFHWRLWGSFLAHQTSLYAAFGLLAFLVALQALIAAYVYKKVL